MKQIQHHRQCPMHGRADDEYAFVDEDGKVGFRDCLCHLLYAADEEAREDEWCNGNLAERMEAENEAGYVKAINDTREFLSSVTSGKPHDVVFLSILLDGLQRLEAGAAIGAGASVREPAVESDGIQLGEHVNWCRDLACQGCSCGHLNMDGNYCNDCGNLLY